VTRFRSSLRRRRAVPSPKKASVRNGVVYGTNRVRMRILIRIVAGVLLVVRGLVHLLFIAPDAGNLSFTFSLDSSGCFPTKRAARSRYVLMAAVGAFGVSALALWGAPGLPAAWPWVLIVAAGLWLVLLILFWNAKLLIGIIISLVLIALAVARPMWMESIST
jgi:hypothetical protein